MSKAEMFRNRLLKVYKHRSKLARRQQLSCYRVYDNDLTEFPFAIDIYEDKLYVAEYKRNHNLTEEEYDAWLEESLQVMQEVLAITAENVFIKQRQRKQGRHGQYEKTGTEKNEFTVTENGLKFRVNLSDYLDTGLFLDHRITRQMVREQSEGKRVLNLFCYTGSFSVYAAAGGASLVTSVDLSKTYLQWADDNMRLNGFANTAKYQFIPADVLQYLGTLPANHFDIVVLDPPTFSNSKRMKDFLDIQRDHVQLINQCLHAMKQDGLLYFST
ncbi:MAG TPA: class I SAM-dependent methyltransferase, partial [Chitinophagaceae bacterium]|nr:class I SAM-dependent methyltransferase [Chitinophagaceae bacterium]